MTYSNKIRERLRISTIILLTFICSFLTIYFHFHLKTGTVFTHFFYIPIILAALWYRRKGLFVAIFLAVLLILSNNFIREEVVTINDYLRAIMFIVIAVVVAALSERIANDQEKSNHLNAILRGIQNVNQLIAQEKERDRLIQKVCENLIETRGYYSAWIALVDENRRFLTAVEAGLGEVFSQVVEMMKQDEFTQCGQNALDQSDIVMFKDVSASCPDCPLASTYNDRAALIVRIEHDNRIYGFLSVSTPAKMADDAFEQVLFKEVAGDIGFALHDIELEEARKQAEKALKLLNEELELKVKERTAHLSVEITERKQVEEALRESEGMFKTLFKDNPAPQVYIDKNIRVLDINLHFQKLFGYKIDDIKGKNIDDVLVPKGMIEEAKDLNKKAQEGYFYHETVRRSNDGKLIPVSVSGIETTVKGKKRYITTYENITERKKAEEALKDSEIRYHNLFENSSEFLFTLDLKGNFTDVNKAAEALSGYTKSELLKMNFKDYSPKRDHRKLFHALYNIYKTGKPLHNFPIEAIIKDKSIKYFETSFNLLRKGEQIIGYQGSSKDITERKKAEEQIKRDLKEKEVLLQEVHHRVKNNMQVISSLLRLQSRYIKDEKALELFQNSQNRVSSMALIHESLYQSKDMANIDFAEYVKRLTTQLFNSFAIYKNLINLKINIKDIMLDINLAIPCGLIINELVSNSLKYAFPAYADKSEGRKGELSVSFTYENQTYILYVKDNGIGISEKINVKEPQTLGLLLVGSLTKQLRGTLELEKVKGTCFKITFQKVELKTYSKV